MKSRIQSLLLQLRKGLYEKDTEVALALLAAVAGQSILLLGPPGVAKSMVARRLKDAFRSARSFEYLMSRFSTPDEIFGPVSISQLKTHDRYRRVTEGFLPSADVVFLDEIWKAGPAIQNTLLTVLNEKIYLNGDQVMHLPLKLLIGASNELPTRGEGLEALWDRFLLRAFSEPVRDEKAFHAMLTDDAPLAPVDETLQITGEEYALWQEEIARIVVPASVLDTLSALRRSLQALRIEGDEMTRTVYVSDRRWKQVVRLLRTSAFLHDRKEVAPEDLLLLQHCLWNEPDERDPVARMVRDRILGPAREKLSVFRNSLERRLRASRVESAVARRQSEGDRRDEDLIIYDDCLYRIDNHGNGQTYIQVSDFIRMDNRRSPNDAPVRGVMYADPQEPSRTVIRVYRNPDLLREGGDDIPPVASMTSVNLQRDDRYIYINGSRYPLHRALRGESLRQYTRTQTSDAEIGLDIETSVDELWQQASSLATACKNHLFASASDRLLIDDEMKAFQRQIALTRADVRQVLYGD